MFVGIFSQYNLFSINKVEGGGKWWVKLLFSTLNAFLGEWVEDEDEDAFDSARFRNSLECDPIFEFLLLILPNRLSDWYFDQSCEIKLEEDGSHA